LTLATDTTPHTSQLPSYFEMLFTPPMTPQTFPEDECSSTTARPIRYQRRTPRLNSQYDGDVSPTFVLPPPLEPTPLALPEPSLSYRPGNKEPPIQQKEVEQEWSYSRDMTPQERDKREEWLAGGRGRRGLRIVIVTGAYTSIILADNQRTSYHVSTESRGHWLDCWSTSRQRDISVCY
jgi:ribosome modulation factor